MFDSKQKHVKTITDFFAFVDDFDSELTLKNNDSGEIINVDAAAMLAGIQSGLVVGGAIVSHDKQLKGSQPMALLVEAIEKASTIYLRRLKQRGELADTESEESDVVAHD